MANNGILPLPEMLSRRDVKGEAGEWRIDTCAPVRGKPMTDIVGKHMVVPVGNEEVDRVIRAHELMHARVSPAHDFGQWLVRGIATEQALICVEEARVNFLIGKAGFDTKHLGDGSETATGTRLAEMKDWAACVYTAAGYANCGGGKDFLTGVRRVNRAWGAALKDIMKRLEKELEKAHKAGTLASTEVDPRNGLAPLGFAHTERLAEWLDRIANTNPVDDNADGDDGAKGDQQEKDNNKKAPAKRGEGEGKQNDKPNPELAKINPNDYGRGLIPTWGVLRPARLPLTRQAKGGLGKKRVAAAIGRNPRRIQNALVDPNRRVFDAARKGNGGVVLIDGSGSMALETRQILEITEHAPGCTVAVYSADKENLKDNLWIIADNGRMVEDIPKRNGGNGVDGEAIRWALKQRKRAATPVVWITDGGVHGLGYQGAWGGYHDTLAMDCIKEVIRGRVHLAKTVNDGIEVLKQLKMGRTPQRWFPTRWKQTYRNLNGKELI